jgi:hypothetical protein
MESARKREVCLDQADSDVARGSLRWQRKCRTFPVIRTILDHILDHSRTIRSERNTINLAIKPLLTIDLILSELLRKLRSELTSPVLQRLGSRCKHIHWGME